MLIKGEPDRVFVSSDFHAFHKNLCKGSTSWKAGATRDYPDEFVMTEALAKSINDKVGADDILIHLGDWSFGGKNRVKEFRSMINCNRIIGLKGNHDYNILKDKDLQKLFWRWYGDFDVDPIVTFQVGGFTYNCSHYAMRVWDRSHHGVRGLYGHSHGSLPDDSSSLSFDVGFCVHKSPLSFVEVESIISQKIWKPVDHHNTHTN